MITYLKAQATAILGSAVDFLVTILLSKLFHYNFVVASLGGNICGAITQFIFGRSWAFHAENGKVSLQIMKYILVWAGNLLLSAGGVYFFTYYMKIVGIVSKIITSVILGLTYNYFMQKKFVFAK